MSIQNCAIQALLRNCMIILTGIYRNWQNHPDTTDAVFIPFQEPEKWGIAVQKGNQELLDQVNAFLKEFREEGGYEELTKTHLSEEKKAFEELGFQWFFDMADETDREEKRG